MNKEIRAKLVKELDELIKAYPKRLSYAYLNEQGKPIAFADNDFYGDKIKWISEFLTVLVHYKVIGDIHPQWSTWE